MSATVYRVASNFHRVQIFTVECYFCIAEIISGFNFCGWGEAWKLIPCGIINSTPLLHTYEAFYSWCEMRNMEVGERAWCVHGYHNYKDIWEAAVSKDLKCHRELCNSEDCYAVADFTHVAFYVHVVIVRCNRKFHSFNLLSLNPTMKICENKFRTKFNGYYGICMYCTGI